MDYLMAADGRSYVQSPGTIPSGSTVVAEVEGISRRDPDRPAVIDDYGTVTYAGLWQATRARMGALQRYGARVGGRVAAYLPNRLDYVVTALACYRLGAILVPLPVNYGVREIEVILGHCEPDVVVLSRRFLDRDLPGDAAATLARCGLGTRILVVEDESGEMPGAASLPPAPEPEAAAAMLYTSGTTGAPKGVVHTHEGLLRMARASNEVRAPREGDVWLCLVPLTHALGLEYGLACPLIGGGTLVLSDTFDAAAAVLSIARHQVAHVVAVPTMVLRMLRQLTPADEVASVRNMYLGGMAAPPEMMRAIAEHFGCTISMTYGATEFGHATMTQLDDRLETICQTSGGPIFGGVELRITEGDRAVPLGTVGQIWVRGPMTFQEYFRDPERTAAARLPSGWITVDDQGYLSPEGNLVVVGRKKDMIVRGGQNIYPNEVEAILHRHPAVLMASVVPVEDPELGERTCACVVALEPGTRLRREDLLPLFDGLARYKIPDYVAMFEEFPQTPSGKVRKDRLRPMAARELGIPERGRRSKALG